MGRVLYLVVAVSLFASLSFPPAVCNAGPEKGKDEVVARVGGQTLTAGGLHEYLKGKPQLLTLLGMPGGSGKIVEAWVLERAAAMRQLKKDGLDPREAIKKLSDDQVAQLSTQTFRDEMPGPVSVTDEDARRAYETNPKKYEVPARVYVQQMSYALAAGSKGPSMEAAEKILKAAKEKLDKGGQFEQVYEETKKDVPALAMKDFGYILLDGSYKGQEIIVPLKSRQSVVHHTGEAVFLTYVVERREPLLEPFDTLKDFIRKDMQTELTAKKRTEYYDGLKKEFDAEILQ